ncbi:MAG: UDP-N-acetylmuramate dehydrogenase [Bacillota bacterium]|nr:UDP-N-acetylmuramate dehydrogenase [Bacillota bacterium]
MEREALYTELENIVGAARLRRNAPMKEYTSFKVGGPADCLAEPAGEEELAAALALLARTQTPHFVMGNGTNLLVRDQGYPGVVLRLGEAFSAVEAEGERIRAGAGALLASVAARAAEAGLQGLEFASGIPGSMGGALFMNAGAYDGEMSRVTEEVRVMARDGSRTDTLGAAEMGYGYRKSALMETGAVVLSAVLKLEPGDPAAIRAQMRELAARRNAKQPVSLPSAGSFFKRPEGNFAGKLIQDAGLKGLSRGGARVSPLHAGFIVNEGDATAQDIIDLMKVVQTAVYQRFGVRLEPEVRII